MITDYAVFLAMLERAKIEYTIHGNTVRVEGGYAGFSTNIEFSETGKLLKVEAYES